MKLHTERNSTLCSVKEEKFYYSMVNARTDYGKRRECGMGTNDISGWENVYSSMGKINFLSHNEKNLKFYRNIEAEQYETLDKCADFWIRKRSHAAFVHFFIEKGLFPDELFTARLNDYVNSFQEKYNCDISWTTLLIMKSEYWRSPDIDSDKLEFNKIEYENKKGEKKKRKEKNDYCYKNDYISRLCRTRNIGRIIKHWKEEGKDMVESYSVPDREIIIQLGFYLNLNSKEVNSLFCAAGLPQFYVLDVIDVVSQYYLDKYHEEGITIPDEWEKEGRERIKEVKDSINRILHIMLDESDENAKTKMYAVAVEKQTKKEDSQKKIEPYRKIAYQKSLCDTVDEEIQKFMKEIEPETEIGSVEGKTFFITNHMKALYEENKDSDFNQMKDYMLLQKDRDRNYMLALEYRYGYIRKIKKVLKKALEKGDYRKNFENIGWNFDVTKPWEYKFLNESKNKGESESLNEPENLVKPKGLENQKKSRLSFSKLKKELLEIWECTDFIKEGPHDRYVKNTWSGTCIDNYIRNRTVSLKTKTAPTNEKVKIPQTMSKCTLTKFIVSMGIEDERDVYFDSVGYGIERKNYQENEKEEIQTKENSYPVDRGDMLFEYVCILRDKLIEGYLEKETEKDTNILKNDLNKSFPFAKMMNYVTRDILYVTEFLAGKKIEENTWLKIETKDNEEESKARKEKKEKKERAQIKAEEKFKIQIKNLKDKKEDVKDKEENKKDKKKNIKDKQKNAKDEQKEERDKQKRPESRLDNPKNSGYCLCFPYSIDKMFNGNVGGEK